MQLGGQDALEPGAAEDERVRIVIECLHPGKDGLGLCQPQRHLRAKIPAGDELSALARQMRVDAARVGQRDVLKVRLAEAEGGALFPVPRERVAAVDGVDHARVGERQRAAFQQRRVQVFRHGLKLIPLVLQQQNGGFPAAGDQMAPARDRVDGGCAARHRAGEAAVQLAQEGVFPARVAEEDDRRLRRTCRELREDIGVAACQRRAAHVAGKALRVGRRRVPAAGHAIRGRAERAGQKLLHGRHKDQIHKIPPA